MTQTRENFDSHVLNLSFEWCEDPIVFRGLIFVFWFKTNIEIGQFDENDFCSLMVVKLLLDHSYVQKAFSTIMRHVDNIISKGTLELNILRALVKIHSNSFVKTWANMIKQKSTKVPGILSVAQISEPVLRRTLRQNRCHFTYFYTLLFLSIKPSFQPQNVLVTLFSTKYYYLSTAKKTSDYTRRNLWCLNFGVRLWPQLNWFNMLMPGFCKQIL